MMVIRQSAQLLLHAAGRKGVVHRYQLVWYVRGRLSFSIGIQLLIACVVV